MNMHEAQIETRTEEHIAYSVMVGLDIELSMADKAKVKVGAERTRFRFGFSLYLLDGGDSCRAADSLQDGLVTWRTKDT